MELLAITWQESFFIVGTLYTGLMFLVTLGAIIGAVVIKRKVKHKIREVKRMPLKASAFLNTFLHAWFTK